MYVLFGDSRLRQMGEIPEFAGDMDIYASLGNMFSLTRLDSGGIRLCETHLELDWPGQLPLEKLPECLFEK